MKAGLFLFLFVRLGSSLIKVDCPSLSPLLQASEAVILMIYDGSDPESRKWLSTVEELSQISELKQSVFAVADSHLDLDIADRFEASELPSMFIISKNERIRLPFSDRFEKESILRFLAGQLSQKMEEFSAELVQKLKKEENYIGHAVICKPKPDFIERVNAVLPTIDSLPIFVIASGSCEQYDIYEGEVMIERRSGKREFEDQFPDHLSIYRFFQFAVLEPLNDLTPKIVKLAQRRRLPMLVLISSKPAETFNEILSELSTTRMKYFFVVARNYLQSDFELDFALKINEGGNRDGTPEIFVVHPGQEKQTLKYPQKDISSRQLNIFLSQIVDRVSKPHRSRRTADQKFNHVKKLTKNNLRRFLDSEFEFKIVLYYDRVCDGCSEAHSMFESLAGFFAGDQIKVTFGSINLFKEKIASSSIAPSIWFYPPGSIPAGIPYSGAFEEEATKAFIVKEMKNFSRKKATTDSDL